MLSWKKKTPSCVQTSEPKSLPFVVLSAILLSLSLALPLQAQNVTRNKESEKSESTTTKKQPDREGALAGLEKTLQFASATERRLAMARIKKLKAEEQARFAPHLARIIREDPDAGIRLAAVDLYGHLKKVADTKVLIEALEDRNSLVVGAAIQSLRRHKVAEASAPIASKMEAEDFKTNNSLLIGMINFLGEQKYKEAAAFLIPKLKESDTDGEVKRAILLYAGQARLLDQKQELLSILSDENAEVGTRAFAANALGHLGDASVAEALHAELDKIEELPDSRTRASFSRLKAQTIFALLRLGDKKVTRYVLAQARDDDPTLRMQAARRISEMKLESGRAHLEYMAEHDPSDKVQQVARKALENWGQDSEP